MSKIDNTGVGTLGKSLYQPMACRLVACKQLSGPMVVYYQSTVRYKGYDEIDSEYILKISFKNIGNLRNDIMNKNAYPFTKYIKTGRHLEWNTAI